MNSKSFLTQCIKAGSVSGAEGWLIKFDYDLYIIKALKWAVPIEYREWREKTSEWWVDAKYSDTLAQLFSNFETFRNQPRLF